MNLHAVKPRFAGESRGVRVFLDDERNVLCVLRAWGDQWLVRFGGVRFNLGSDRGWSDGQVPAQTIRMRHAAHIPKLQKNPAAVAMTRVRDLPPTFDVRSIVNARRSSPTITHA